MGGQHALPPPATRWAGLCITSSRELDAWRLFSTFQQEPGRAMGLDEALLEAPGPPTLRFYTWKPAALSLGYFQRPEEIPACAQAEVVVRRLTGGGAIHHAAELTFSISVDAEDPRYRGPVAASYSRIHAWLISGLAPWAGEVHERGSQSLDSESQGTGMCFHKSAPQDLIWGHRKGVGSAQRRRGGRILHHGSIKIAPDPLEPGVATLVQSVDDLDPKALAQHLALRFAEHFEVNLQPGEPSEALNRRAEALGPRYSSPEFLHRRR